MIGRLSGNTRTPVPSSGIMLVLLLQPKTLKAVNQSSSEDGNHQHKSENGGTRIYVCISRKKKSNKIHSNQNSDLAEKRKSNQDEKAGGGDYKTADLV